MGLFKFFLIVGAVALVIGVILMNTPSEVGSLRGKIIGKLAFGFIVLGAIVLATALAIYGWLK